MREQTYSITPHIQRYSCEQHGRRELQMSPQMERVTWRQACKLYESCYRWFLHNCLIDNVSHVLSPQMLMPSTLTPEITHAHSAISVCYIDFQTWDLVMTVLLWMCVEKRANSASRFSVLGSFVGPVISGCLLLLWSLFKQGENSSLNKFALDIGPRVYITNITKWYQISL